MGRLEEEIQQFLNNKGTDWMYCVDISGLSEELNRGLPLAVLFGVRLSRAYLDKVRNTPGYVKQMVREGLTDQDEFHLLELKMDRIADDLAVWLKGKGFDAYSQSERNILQTGQFNEEDHRTPLPHKAIALRAGMGWIGRNDLLVNREYGCALSMCSVLTDAPLQGTSSQPVLPECGDCTICVERCPVDAISGKMWGRDIDRDELLDVNKCITCLECMAFCPWNY